MPYLVSIDASELTWWVVWCVVALASCATRLVVVTLHEDRSTDF